jgi:competence protein ComEA
MNVPLRCRSTSIGYRSCHQRDEAAQDEPTFVAGTITRRAVRAHRGCADNRGISMTVNRVILSVLALALVSAPVLAQDAGKPATPPPAAKAPATTGKATAPVAAKVNLNTATAAQLNKLPRGNVMNSRAIIEARAKSKFKDWDDFMARKVVPADAAAAIKDSVTF